jgi:hypothetical protein
MPKRNLESIDVACWRHATKLGHSEPTICVHHRAVELGLPLLNAIDELVTSGTPAKRLLTFLGTARKQCITHFRLKVSPERSELKVMFISCENGAATIELTPRGLLLVRRAVEQWLAGGEDFCVSPEHSELKPRELGPLDKASGELWFWGPSMEP